MLLDRIAVTGRFHKVLQLSIKLDFPLGDSGTRCPKSIMQGEELQGASRRDELNNPGEVEL